MFKAYKEYWQRYFDFSGRTIRSKFWWVILMNLIIGTIVSFLGYIVLSISDIYYLATFIPTLSIGCRRLHDIKKTGWHLLWALLPIVGWIILIVFFAKKSKFK